LGQTRPFQRVFEFTLDEIASLPMKKEYGLAQPIAAVEENLMERMYLIMQPTNGFVPSKLWGCPGPMIYLEVIR
jgi:hypothetical protein